MLTIIWAVVLFLVLFMVGLYRHITCKTVEKLALYQLSQLVLDGLLAFSKRSMSIVLQVILYLMLIMFSLSYGLNKVMDWTQFLVFGIGGVTMGVSHFLSLLLVPRFIVFMGLKSKSFLNECISYTLDISKFMSLLMVLPVVLVLILMIYIFGTDSVIGYGLGVLLTSFFLRVGGGVFRCSAKIAKSVIERVESSLPQDRRNPALFLDVIGGYIGGMMGFCADILSSFMVVFISLLLSVNVFVGNPLLDDVLLQRLQLLPLYIFIIGACVSIISYIFTKYRVRFYHKNVLLESIYLSLALNCIGVYMLCRYWDLDRILVQGHAFMPFFAFLMGVMGSVLIAFLTDYVTSVNYKPGRYILEQSEMGPASVLFNGLASGLQSNGIFLFLLIVMSLLAHFFADIYGVGLASLGLLSVMMSLISSKVLASLSESFSIISKSIESSDAVQKNARNLSKLGYTTMAIGNGFSSAISIIASVSLVLAMGVQSNINAFATVWGRDVIIGLGIGLLVSFLFSGSMCRGVVRAITYTRKEVLRQFREIPYLFENKAQPDVIKAANSQAIHSLKALTVPGLCLILPPLVIGPIFGIKMMFGFLIGVLLMGASQGFWWCNVGDAVQNASRYMEEGYFGGEKGVSYQNISYARNYAVVYNEALGPSHNVLIKAACVLAVLIGLYWVI